MLALFTILMFMQSTATLPSATPPTATLPTATQAVVTPISAATRMNNTLAMGRRVAVQNCQTCHAIGRTGASPNPSAPRFRNLSAKYPINSLSEAFAEGVFIGHSVMPEFEFAPGDVDALMVYIKSVQVRPKKRPRNPVQR